MNRSILKSYKLAAEETGFSIDESSQLLFGTKRGFEAHISPVLNVKAFYITMFIKYQEQQPAYADINQIVKLHKKLLNRCEVKGYQIRFQVPIAASFKGYDKAMHKTMEALDMLTETLQAKGYENACAHCGTSAELENYVIGGSSALLCEPCYHATSEQKETEKQFEDERKENIIGGVVGAFLGSLLGGICIVILGQLGYVAALSGMVMGVCALKGYEWMGGKLTKTGIIISIAVMVVMVYISNRLDYAIAIVRYYDDVDVLEAFQYIPELVAEGYITASAYYRDIALVYLFTAVGSYSTIVNILKNQKNASLIQRLQK